MNKPAWPPPETHTRIGEAMVSTRAAQSNVEYAILIATIAIIVLVGVSRFGDLIRPWFQGLASHITTTGT